MAGFINVVTGGDSDAGIKQTTGQSARATKQIHSGHLDALSADNSLSDGSLVRHDEKLPDRPYTCKRKSERPGDHLDLAGSPR